ncbi:MAG: hypothetical protein P8L68_01295 [Paracoccaceae bacterium]|nr:hypothetical protein [Paracoccaceae bacterium]MDG2257115.1 hypothetical protein [Paracoccaceae bacterium]
MDLDTMLVVGFVLGLFSIPAILAAWSENRPLYFRLSVLALALGFIAWPTLRFPAEYGPSNWVEVSLTVAARIIP